MAITDSQKIDLLFKKVGYGIAKTDTSINKSPANEANASPMVSPGSTIYQQDYAIPTVSSMPTSNSSVVTVYRDSLTSTIQCSKLPTTSANVSWTTGLTDWVPVQYGTGYQIKVYAGPSGSSTPQNYTQLFPDGSGSNDSWYFDYQSGILNFADTSVPSAASSGGNVIYVAGARYTGIKGVTTFANLTVTGNITSGNSITSGNTYSNVIGNLIGNVSGNIVGTYGTFANISGNVITSSQPYITSLGTLTGLAVAGNTTTGNLTTVGTNYGNVAADTITSYSTSVVSFTNPTAIKLPTGSTSARPAGTAGYIRYNSDLSVIEYYNGSQWVSINNQITQQTINGNGVLQSFTLSQATTVAGVIVSINGTVQQPTSAYTISGTTITFAEIPSATDVIDVRFLASTGVVTLDYAVVDTSNISVGTSNVIIDSFLASQYRSAKYVVSSSNATDASMLEVFVVQMNGTTVLNTIANTNTGSSYITFYANTSGGTVNFIAKGTVSSNNLRLQRTYFLV